MYMNAGTLLRPKQVVRCFEVAYSFTEDEGGKIK